MAPLSSLTCPPGGAVQLTRLVRQVAPCSPRHWSARWRRSARRLVRQVAPFSSPDSFARWRREGHWSARWRRSVHPTCPPGGAVQTTQDFRQVAPCSSHHSRVVTTPGRTPGMMWSPAGTSTNLDERRVSFTTPVSAVPTVKASGKTARSSETPRVK